MSLRSLFVRAMAVLSLILSVPTPAAIAFVQFKAAFTAYINITPTAGNALFFTNTISSAYGGTLSTVQAMSATNGGGSVLATFTIPASLATHNFTAANLQVSGAYLLNLPSGTLSVLGTWTAGTPGTNFVSVVELSGVDTSAGYVTAVQNGISAPGSGTDAITSGTTSVSSSATYLLGMYSDFNNHVTAVAGTSYTILATGSNGSRPEGQAISSSGTYAATFTDATNGADDFGVTMFAVKPVGSSSCTNSGYTSAGGTAVPNGTTGSYWGKSGAFVTPDCSTVYYWSPAAGNFVLN